MPLTSAGILLYNRKNKETEVFLVHPGGPFFAGKDKGWWGIPKGLPAEKEDLFETAKREFLEETGFLPEAEFAELGFVKQKGGKTVYAWAAEGDLPGNWRLKCNTFTLEWPPRSGSYKSYPEVDDARFFTISEAKEYMNQAQSAFLDRLLEHLHLKP